MIPEDPEAARVMFQTIQIVERVAGVSLELAIQGVLSDQPMWLQHSDDLGIAVTFAYRTYVMVTVRRGMAWRTWRTWSKHIVPTEVVGPLQFEHELRQFISDAAPTP